MLSNLLNQYSKQLLHLTDLESQKTHSEMNFIDINSKETMTKLVAKLRQENENYHRICDEIEVYKAHINILDKKINTIRSVTHLFKDISELNNFISTITQA